MPEPTVHAGIDITPFVWLLLAASIVAMLARRIRVPYALEFVITGLLIGVLHLLRKRILSLIRSLPSSSLLCSSSPP